MLSPLVKEWAPEAFVISFKLETDPLILIDKSRQALEKYRHQVVVANILESRRTSVIIVTKDSQTPLTLSEEEIAQGMEIEEKIVSYLQGQHTLFMEKKIWWAALDEANEIVLERTELEQHVPCEWNNDQSNPTEKAAVQNSALFYCLVIVAIACFKKNKTVKCTEVKAFQRMVFCLVCKEGKVILYFCPMPWEREKWYI